VWSCCAEHRHSRERATAWNLHHRQHGQHPLRISQDESQVEYNIYELLNGADTTVVGTTSEVAGDIIVNLSDLSQSEIGELSINARTFATDEIAVTTPLPASSSQSESDANEVHHLRADRHQRAGGQRQCVGATLTFTVTGDLTIAGTRQSATFDVTAPLDMADTLTGSAETSLGP
jgi:hypothetical protein